MSIRVPSHEYRGQGPKVTPSSVDVRNEWSYASSPTTRPHGLNREYFTFYFYETPD